MLNQLKNSLDKVNASEEFKKYKEDHEDSYLTSAFLIFGEDDKKDWQLDFYSKKEHKITSFIVKDDIQVQPSEKIFQKEVKELDPLNIDNIKLELDQAFEKIDEVIKEKKLNETPSKKIVILQNFNGKEIWNITYITTTFNLINTKIDAISGEVIESKFLFH